MKKILEKIKRRIFNKRGPGDWDKIYLGGTPPWDSGQTCRELEKSLQELIQNTENGLRLSGNHILNALELGCGTGTNSIFLARQGFKVTGVDISNVALQAAQKKASDQKTNVSFIQTSLPNLPLNGETFDFIFDRGCYHCLTENVRKDYANMVADHMKKSGKFLLLTGNAREPQNPGPPVLTEQEIINIFNERFHILRIRDTRLGNADSPGKDALGHSCLMELRF